MTPQGLMIRSLLSANAAPKSTVLSDLAAVPPRLALGSSMVYHGTAKLRGQGPEQTGQFFEAVGIKPGVTMARVAGWAEALSGALTMLGLGTRIAALTVLATQAVAVQKVHAAKGYDIMKGGYEYNLAIVGIALALLLRGPGRLSLHEGLERLVEGRGARRLASRARPGPLLRFLKLLK